MVELWTDADRRQRPARYHELVAQLVRHNGRVLAERRAARLVRRNRRIIAERVRWPVGALQMCEHLDAVRPDWTAWWQPENTIAGWEHPAGYVASRRSSGYVCGEDPAALIAAMRRAPDERHWHYHAACCDRVPASETY